MNLDKLFKIFSDNNCKKVYAKRLAANDNSKNQVYFGGSFEVLNILPIKDVSAEGSSKGKDIRFKSKLDFYWVNDEGLLSYAPNAQLILYPQYPEVRFSGFLNGCRDKPSALMSSRLENRLLFLGISSDGNILGYVVAPDSGISLAFDKLEDLGALGVFKEISINKGGFAKANTKLQLLDELRRIHDLGWIDSKRLNSKSEILPCSSSNCGGYTLEAELGINPNSYSEPDFLGWEIKQIGVKDFRKYNSAIVTLMTPEPTHGLYVEDGIEAFIWKYGYKDKAGREERMNFGGIHKCNIKHQVTRLRLVINGYDPLTRKINDINGYIGLIDENGCMAASWSFSSLLKHWNTKHANACYVPAINRKNAEKQEAVIKQYAYGNIIRLGNSTDFTFFLNQIYNGNIYYDPGIKIESAIADIRKKNIKRRSQFRIKSVNLSHLYKENEIIDLREL